MKGTIRVWPGVAEELVGTKAYYVRAGMFKDVDVVLFTHVGDNLNVSWGSGAQNGLVSVEYQFVGESAHAAGGSLARPQRARCGRADGRGLEFPPRASAACSSVRTTSSPNGGDQPNVVPPNASRLVLLPRDGLSAHQAAVGDRRQDGARRGVDDRYHVHLACARHRMARPTSTSRSPKRCTKTSRKSACRNGARPIRRLRRGFRKS